MVYTTLEQSKQLYELGLDPCTADMCWGIDADTMHYNNNPYNLPWKDYTAKEYYVPCWSMEALINLLPNSVKIKGIDYLRFSDFDHITYLGGYWSGGYHYKAFEEYTTNQTLMDVLYKCIVWLLGLEINYLKKNG